MSNDDALFELNWDLENTLAPLPTRYSDLDQSSSPSTASPPDSPDSASSLSNSESPSNHPQAGPSLASAPSPNPVPADLPSDAAKTFSLFDDSAPTALVPRNYQIELFERAYKENIIVFLETGAGKTLVSALLIRKVLEDQEKAATNGGSSSSTPAAKSPLEPMETSPMLPANPSLNPVQVSSGSTTAADPHTSKSTPAESMVDTPHAPPQLCLPSSLSNPKAGPSRPAANPVDDSMFLMSKHATPAPQECKIVVFLVHRVPLVPQQAAAIREVMKTSVEVGEYFGEKGVDCWSSSKWAKSLRTKKVLVMTAQIFLNLLRHGLLDIRDVALLILDEVHHATKSHPYRKLFMEFYHTLEEGEPRPRVFGMTASPVKARSSSKSSAPCMTAILSLEATMDATVVTVSQTTKSEVEELVPKPEEFVVTYKKSLVGYEKGGKLGQLESPSVAELLDLVGLIEASGESEGDAPSVSASASEDGHLTEKDWKVMRFLHHQLGYQAAKHFAKELCHLKAIPSAQCLKDLLSQCAAEEIECGGISNKARHLLDLLFAERMRCWGEYKASGELIRQERENYFRCIVFVGERIVAQCLTWLINEVFTDLKCTELKARSAVGTQQPDSRVRMSQSKLLNTIEDFREGRFGILVATNVLEEGLDVPACRLVIAFDKVNSPASYVQGRGRARKRGARYISFVAEGDVDDIKNMFSVREGARLMRNILDNGVGSVDVKERMKDQIREEAMKGEKKLFSNSTRARVTATESVNLLYRYCIMKAASMKEEKASKPLYTVSQLENGGFVCRISLHHRLPIDGGVCSEPQVSEVQAKRLAALDTYTKLYQVKEVDDFLLPKREKKSVRALNLDRASNPRPAVMENRRKRRCISGDMNTKVSKKDRRVRQCRIIHPAALQNTSNSSKVPTATSRIGDPALSPNSLPPKGFSEDSEVDGGSNCEKNAVIPPGKEAKGIRRLVYRVRIDFNPKHLGFTEASEHLAVGLVLENPVHDDDLCAIRCPDGSDLISLSFEREVLWSKARQCIANKYVRSIQLCLRGKSPGSTSAIAIEKSTYGDETETNFFLVPLKRVEAGAALDIDWGSMKKLLCFGWRCGPQEKIDADCGSRLQNVLVCSYHEDLTRVYLSGRLSESVKASSHPRGYLNPLYTSFADYFLRKHDTEVVDHEQNMLEAFCVLDKLCDLSTSTFMLPPEIVRVIPLSPMICYIASLLPRWQTFLALRDCWRRNRLSSDSPAFLSFARALQPNVNNVAKDRADLSYERLEFLGDAVLKVVYSMSSFVMNPNDSEGLLSDERDVEVSNQKLADLAVEMKIHDCVAFSGISQKAKAWPWFWGSHQNKNIHISEKVLADCVESLIGVQYLHGGLASAAEFMDRHNVLPRACEVLGISESTDNSGVVVPVPNMNHDDERQTSKFITDVEDVLGYSFRDKGHLVVALTHGSFRSGHSPSYQRYEYLGDAIIGFLLLSHLFHAYPDLSPGDLTSLRGPALSNDLFARVIVSLNIHEKFWHDCAPLDTEIKKFAHLVANEEEEDDDVCKLMTVPKVLGDLLESIIGAIVVDQSMKLDGVQEIVLRLMSAELDRFASPTRFKRNPISELVHLVQKQYNVLPEYSYLDKTHDDLKSCAIKVCGRQICQASGPTRRLAKHKAAIEALGIVKEMIETEKCDGSA
eukprot:GFKZ01000308.1.p1 GENE.GFKZ01000308.1~~GFKZ01000308.1.p1  ORF type:complete len:1667 (+),score=210.82 GFKZ01000308.1:718-5718(+)